MKSNEVLMQHSDGRTTEVNNNSSVQTMEACGWTVIDGIPAKVESAGETPAAPMTKDQIKEILDAKKIAYPATATKADLLELLYPAGDK